MCAWTESLGFVLFFTLVSACCINDSLSLLDSAFFLMLDYAQPARITGGVCHQAVAFTK